MSSKHVLVINCGSSSLKYALYAIGDATPLQTGLAEELNSPNARHISKDLSGNRQSFDTPNASHGDSIQAIVDALNCEFNLSDSLIAVGHRVVHGGERFNKATLIDDSVLAEIKQCIQLAPLHNPANITGIELLQKQFPEVPQVAVFDTAFHQTMPEHAYRYAIPSEFYTKYGVRRYGFHGTSHQYVASSTAQHIGKPIENCSFITAHLGNGASVCAIENGKSVDTSMGMTPLEGLVMGTRSGDVDPGLIGFLGSQGYDCARIDKILNKQSGLLGLSGISNDCRTLEEQASKGNKEAQLALKVFCYRLAKYIAGMRIALTQCNGLIFTGGIGENSVFIRKETVALLKGLGFTIDEELNRDITDNVCAIQSTVSLPIFVSRTDEERLIAEQSAALCS